MEYRKKIELDRDKDYWFVRLGELNRLIGPADYPFPTAAAAQKFAEAHKYIAKTIHGIDREVSIRNPDGSVHDL